MSTSPGKTLNEDVDVKQETSPDIRSQNARAVDALQEVRGMPPGAQRANALKKAGLLRRVADGQGVIFAKKGRPPQLGGL
jgi:hypothetical protein